MYAMVYLKHLQKSSERRWANRVARELPVRWSRPEGPHLLLRSIGEFAIFVRCRHQQAALF